jgi:hypothetical protein
MTENSGSLTGWRVLKFQGDGFFDMLIKLIRRVPTMKSEYVEGFNTQRNFPTIIHQLSDEWNKVKSGTSGVRTYILQGYIIIY